MSRKKWQLFLMYSAGNFIFSGRCPTPPKRQDNAWLAIHHQRRCACGVAIYENENGNDNGRVLRCVGGEVNGDYDGKVTVLTHLTNCKP